MYNFADCAYHASMERHTAVEGIILRNRRTGDIDRRVTLLSPEIGIIDATAYGARKSKGSLSGKIDSFTSGRWFLYHNPVRDIYKIEDADQLVQRDFLRESLAASYTASFWAESILKTHGGIHESAPLYHQLISSLQALQDQGSSDGLLVQSIWRFLGIIGYGLILDRCSQCGRIIKDQDTLFLHGDGDALTCPLCTGTGGDGGSGMILPGGRRYLQVTTEMPLHEALRVGLSDESMRALKRLLLQYLDILTEGTMQTIKSGLI